jgi:hypothetical protein
VIESPKTEAQIAAEQSEREERAVLNTRVLMLGALLIAVGFFLFIAFMVQAVYLWLALRAMRRSTAVAAHNVVSAQRAFVYIRSLAWRVDGANVKIDPTWENSGLTPTQGLRISVNWKAGHDEPPADFAYAYTRPPDRLFIGPRGQVNVGAVLIPMRDVQAAIEGRVQLYFWARAAYDDVFPGAQAHYTECCYRLDVTGATPGNISLTFALYGPYNRSDGDSPTAALQR